MISLSSGVDPEVWLPQKWVKLRYLGVRLWSHCHRGWIRRVGCLKGELNYVTSVYVYVKLWYLGVRLWSHCHRGWIRRFGCLKGENKMLNYGTLGVRLWSHCHRGWIRRLGRLKGELNYGTSVYDYDLIVIGGGSGGLAASKVRIKCWTTEPRCTTMISLSSGVDPEGWLPQRWE